MSLILLLPGGRLPHILNPRLSSYVSGTHQIGILLSSRLAALCFSYSFIRSFVCPFIHVSICLLIHSNPEQIFRACQLCAGDPEGKRKGVSSPPRSPSHEKSEKRVVRAAAGAGSRRCPEEVRGPGAAVRKGVPQVAMPSASFSKQKDGKALSTTTTSYPCNQAIGGSATCRLYHLDTPHHQSPPPPFPSPTLPYFQTF